MLHSAANVALLGLHPNNAMFSGWFRGRLLLIYELLPSKLIIYAGISTLVFFYSRSNRASIRLLELTP